LVNRRRFAAFIGEVINVVSEVIEASLCIVGEANVEVGNAAGAVECGQRCADSDRETVTIRANGSGGALLLGLELLLHEVGVVLQLFDRVLSRRKLCF
jgi:hypothetical protein